MGDQLCDYLLRVGAGMILIGGTSWEAFLLGGHVPITDPRQGVTLNGLSAKSALGVGARRER